jgi:hypothetical protein
MNTMSKMLLYGVLSVCGWSSIACAPTKTELGTTQVGAYSVHVFIEGNVVAAGAESRMVLKASPGMPTSITGWLGTASGDGSIKALAVYDSADGDYDDDVMAPSPLPVGAMFWFEMDTSGTKDVGSIAFAK